MTCTKSSARCDIETHCAQQTELSGIDGLRKQLTITLHSVYIPYTGYFTHCDYKLARNLTMKKSQKNSIVLLTAL